jgi:hypothetical protein
MHPDIFSPSDSESQLYSAFGEEKQVIIMSKISEVESAFKE